MATYGNILGVSMVIFLLLPLQAESLSDKVAPLTRGLFTSKSMHSGARKLFSRRWYLSNQVVHPSKFVYEASARLVSAQHPCPSYPSASSPWSQGEGGMDMVDV